MFDCFDKDKFQYPIDWNEYQDVRTGRDRSNRIFGESLEKMSDVALLHFVGRCLHGLLMDTTDVQYAKEAAKDKLDKLLIETVFRNNFRVFVSGNDGIAEVSKDVTTEHALTDKIDWKKWEENRTVIGWGNFGKYGDIIQVKPLVYDSERFYYYEAGYYPVLRKLVLEGEIEPTEELSKFLEDYSWDIDICELVAFHADEVDLEKFV